MASVPVHHVDVRAFCYATEICDRVQSALEVIYPVEDDDGPAFTRRETSGHYGDPIEVFELSLSRSTHCEAVIDRILDRGDPSTIRAELPNRVTDDCDLYLRFDKQRAYSDRQLVLGDGIEVRIKLEAYPAEKHAAIDNFEEYLTARLDQAHGTQ